MQPYLTFSNALQYSATNARASIPSPLHRLLSMCPWLFFIEVISREVLLFDGISSADPRRRELSSYIVDLNRLTHRLAYRRVVHTLPRDEAVTEAVLGRHFGLV